MAEQMWRRHTDREDGPSGLGTQSYHMQQDYSASLHDSPFVQRHHHHNYNNPRHHLPQQYAIAAAPSALTKNAGRLPK